MQTIAHILLEEKQAARPGPLRLLRLLALWPPAAVSMLVPWLAPTFLFDSRTREAGFKDRGRGCKGESGSDRDCSQTGITSEGFGGCVFGVPATAIVFQVERFRVLRVVEVAG